MFKLFNTMTKSKEDLKAKDPISIYTCGPTVYLDLHIGNWRTFIFYDTLVRALKTSAHDVKHVINITDVGHLVSDGDTGEDKLVKTAQSEQKTAWEVADQYTKLFLDGMNALNMLKPTKLPKATDHIQQQIKLIQAIEANGHTYKIDDGIYFDTASIENYGKLAGGKVGADEDFARINKNDQKRNTEDFALWKFSPEGEKRDMEWESPWGVGFPGWHLECSAMAQEYLGETIDIHAGGVDHIPVHHTNEIAQSEAATGQEFAHIWLHAEFMKVDNAKMSKSLGNFYTLADIEARGFTPADLRMLVVQGHYRTETNFTWDNLQAAANRLSNLRAAAEKRWQLSDGEDNSAKFIEFKNQISAALEDDLNTPEALKALGGATALAENGLSAESAQAYIECLQVADKLLGLDLIESTPDINDEQKEILEIRQQARREKNFEESDKLRDQLANQGITVLDKQDRQTWQQTA